MKINIHENNEPTDYNSVKLKRFRNIAYAIIKNASLTKNEQEAKKEKVQDLLAQNGGKLLYGKIFHSVSSYLGLDIDNICEELFSDYEYPLLNSKKNTYENKYVEFISGITHTDGEIATAIGASGSRISRIRNSFTETDFLAYQVYALAKVTGVTPSQLFEYFYGDGERPLIGFPLRENDV